MDDSRLAGHDSSEHHCYGHTRFTATCDECRRARAAFLPYQDVSPHPEPGSRSFQRTLGPSFVVTPPLTADEATNIGTAEGVSNSITTRILDALFGR